MTGLNVSRFVSAAAVGVIVLLGGCDEVTSATVPLVLVAEDADGNPLAKVQIWANGRDLGHTEADGRLTTRVHGPTGTQVTLTRTCPQGFEAEEQQRTVRIKEVRGKSDVQSALELRFQCRALQLLTALVVRAPNDDHTPLPISVSGQVVGQTDSDGAGHVLLRVFPDSTIRVEVDTAKAPQLLPRNPVRTFQVGSTAELLLFDQSFTKLPPHRKRVTRRPAKASNKLQAPKRIR